MKPKPNPNSDLFGVLMKVVDMIVLYSQLMARRGG